MTSVSVIRAAAAATLPVSFDVGFTVEGSFNGEDLLLEGLAETCLFEGQACVLSVNFDDETLARLAEVSYNIETAQLYAMEELGNTNGDFHGYATEVVADRLTQGK